MQDEQNPRAKAETESFRIVPHATVIWLWPSKSVGAGDCGETLAVASARLSSRRGIATVRLLLIARPAPASNVPDRASGTFKG